MQGDGETTGIQPVRGFGGPIIPKLGCGKPFKRCHRAEPCGGLVSTRFPLPSPSSSCRPSCRTMGRGWVLHPPSSPSGIAAHATRPPQRYPARGIAHGHSLAWLPLSRCGPWQEQGGRVTALNTGQRFNATDEAPRRPRRESCR